VSELASSTGNTLTISKGPLGLDIDSLPSKSTACPIMNLWRIIVRPLWHSRWGVHEKRRRRGQRLGVLHLTDSRRERTSFWTLRSPPTNPKKQKFSREKLFLTRQRRRGKNPSKKKTPKKKGKRE